MIRPMVLNRTSTRTTASTLNMKGVNIVTSFTLKSEHFRTRTACASLVNEFHFWFMTFRADTLFYSLKVCFFLTHKVDVTDD